MNRRGFLAGIIAAAVAPAIIRTPGLIMPIKPSLVAGFGGVDYEIWAWNGRFTLADLRRIETLLMRQTVLAQVDDFYVVRPLAAS